MASDTRAKVLTVRAEDASALGEKLEEALNEFLSSGPTATIRSTQMHVLDIGGPSQADIVALCVILYSL